MENFTPFSALGGGALIGISVTLLLLFNGRIGGISGIMNGVFFAPKNDRMWRLIFLFGLILGAVIFQLVMPDFNVPRQNYPLFLLGVGGILIGIGTRMSGGCTSGHGICGIANLSIRSLIATLTFMMTGMITVYIIRHSLELTL
ncbi:YeeE/YedE family protein [Methylobacter psychrophilus]|uniref:YeeE/YedE family protein n=1 Tax=Methylobacter psychrophilus TaxID=96941 RepID=UPI0021D4D6E9|nr:YeeE/YedE thiosulfate transporter family protein [Methylobacter psychrophilus]